MEHRGTVPLLSPRYQRQFHFTVGLLFLANGFGGFTKSRYLCSGQHNLTDMSTATLTNLRDYLYGTLTTSNMLWLASQLKEYAMREKQSHRGAYTVEELHARIEQSEKESAAGLGQDADDMFRELEEEFAREDLEMAEAV